VWAIVQDLAAPIEILVLVAAASVVGLVAEDEEPEEPEDEEPEEPEDEEPEEPEDEEHAYS
jgi:hypothetical protein